jgi:hypothetical protein
MALTPYHSGKPLDTLPSADELPAPEDLFSGPPYILTLLLSKASITIQGTHPTSLSLIKDYFEKYTPRNPNDTRNVGELLGGQAASLSLTSLGLFIRADYSSQPPYLRYILRPSYVLAPKSPGNCDTLIIERYVENWHWLELNPAPFMSFIEGVMGYEQTRHDGYLTSYTRRKPFLDTFQWEMPPAYTGFKGT